MNKHYLSRRINLICFDPNTQYAFGKKGCINSITSLKGAALWSSVKRRSSAVLTVCNLKDTLNYRQQKLGMHAASIITARQMIHHRTNGLTETSCLPRNFKNACARLIKSAHVYRVTFFLQWFWCTCCQQDSRVSQFIPSSLTYISREGVVSYRSRGGMHLC